MFFLDLQTKMPTYNIQIEEYWIIKTKQNKLVRIVMGIVLEINSIYSTILLVADN